MTAKLQKSERTKAQLQGALESHERDLRRARNELEINQIKWDASKNTAPIRPPRGSSKREEARFAKLSAEHEQKMKEYSILAEENELLRTQASARRSNLVREVTLLKQKLSVSEKSLKEEVVAKTMLLNQLEDASGAAQQNLIQMSKLRAIAPSNSQELSHKDLERRKRARQQREQYLRERLGVQFNVYAKTLAKTLSHITESCFERDSVNPTGPLEALKVLLLHPCEKSFNLAADKVFSCLVNFGASLSIEQKELLQNHYDIEGAGDLNVLDFIADLEEILIVSPANGAGVRAARKLPETRNT